MLVARRTRHHSQPSRATTAHRVGHDLGHLAQRVRVVQHAPHLCQGAAGSSGSAPGQALVPPASVRAWQRQSRVAGELKPRRLAQPKPTRLKPPHPPPTSGLASTIWRTAGLACSMLRSSSGLRSRACRGGHGQTVGRGARLVRRHAGMLGWSERGCWRHFQRVCAPSSSATRRLCRPPQRSLACVMGFCSTCCIISAWVPPAAPAPGPPKPRPPMACASGSTAAAGEAVDAALAPAVEAAPAAGDLRWAGEHSG